MNQDLIGLIPAAGKGVRLGLPYPKELYPVIRENRYKPIAQFVLDNLAAGLTTDEIVNSYPPLSPEAVRAAIAYAAELGRERVVAMPDTVYA